MDFKKAQQLVRAIEDSFVAFIGQNLGTDMLSDEDKQVLDRWGIDWKKSYSPNGKIDDMFRLGMMAEALGQDNVRNMPESKLYEWISTGKFLPLSPAEKNALEAIKFGAYGDIKGLGNRIGKDCAHVIIEADSKLRENYEKLIQDEAAKAIARRRSVKQLASTLGQKSGDWARDFDRIADFIMHSALDAGIAQQILKTHGGDAEVYKDVYPGACSQCAKAYLKAGIGSEPKIFKLKDIMANGTNIGKKQVDWLPVIGPHHPFCRCTLQFKPENEQWSDTEGDFILVRNHYGVNRKSKAKIKVEF